MSKLVKIIQSASLVVAVLLDRRSPPWSSFSSCKQSALVSLFLTKDYISKKWCAIDFPGHNKDSLSLPLRAVLRSLEP